MQTTMIRILSAIAILLISLSTAQAQSPQLLDRFSDWAAFKHTRNGKVVCFAVTKPKSSKTNPANVNRGPIFFFVNREPEDNIIDELNVTIGYPFKPESDAVVQIGSDKFEFFTKGDGAWVKNAALEKTVIAAMKRGAEMTVTGTSSRGTVTVDTYSLLGATAAMKRIATACPA